MTKSSITLLSGLFLFFLSLTLTAQETDPTKVDYTEVDSYVLSLSGSSFMHVRDLVNHLTENFDTEAEKTRAIFRWMAENISYDCAAEAKNDHLKDKDRNKWKAWQAERKRNFLPRVFKERKGAYDDHALFFKDLCDSAEVTVRFISGYGRNDESRLGKRPPRRANHWWNAVRLNKTWYLLDVAWAAGESDCEAKSNQFQKKFAGYYYLTPPSRFIMNHLPEDEGWQLVEEASDRHNMESFFLTPQVWGGYFQNGIDAVDPEAGLIEMPEDTTITFSFKSSMDFDTITVFRTRKIDNEYETEELETVPIRKESGNLYSYAFTPPEKGRRFFLTFTIKGIDVVTYKVLVVPGSS